MSLQIATIDDVRKAERVVRQHVSPAPLVRSYPLEKELGLPASRRVWLKDYGWTPVGSFKLLDGEKRRTRRWPSRRCPLVGKLRRGNCVCRDEV